MTNLMQQYVSGLKSRSEDTRNKAAQQLNHYVTTELREVSESDLTAFMDDFNHHIFEMVSSPDVNERKGGILAIGMYVISKNVSVDIVGFKYSRNSRSYKGLSIIVKI